MSGMSGTRLAPAEYEDLRRLMRTFFAHEYPELTPDEESPPEDRNLWTRMAREIGVQGMMVPERWGGSGATLAEVALVFEEAGRVLCPAPLLSTVAMATTALLASQDEEAMERFLPGIVEGTLTAAVALPRSFASQVEAGNDLAVGAIRTHDGWIANGVVDLVIDGSVADVLLVPADTPDGPVLLSLSTEQQGVLVSERPALDRSRRLARYELAQAQADAVGRPGFAVEILHEVREAALICLAAEQIGAAERCLEMSVSYAGQRMAFGTLIGSFQAVKHKCADMLVELESAKALQSRALDEVLAQAPERAITLAMAGSYSSEMFKHVSADNIQLHGAIGFSWEFPAHLYYKRATADAVLLCSPRDHRKRLVELLDY